MSEELEIAIEQSPDMREEHDNMGLDFKPAYDYNLKVTTNSQLCKKPTDIGSILKDRSHNKNIPVSLSDMMLKWFCSLNGSFMNCFVEYAFPNIDSTITIIKHQSAIQQLYPGVQFFNSKMPLSHRPSKDTSQEFCYFSRFYFLVCLFFVLCVFFLFYFLVCLFFVLCVFVYFLFFFLFFAFFSERVSGLNVLLHTCWDQILMKEVWE